MSKYFLVSVANVLGRDPATGRGLFYGTTNASTAVNLSMSEEEIRGGINNVVQGIYYHDKTLECTIEKATFSREFLRLNVGADKIQSSNVNVLQTECVTLDANGMGYVKKMPVGAINVFADEDTVEQASASATADENGYAFSVASMAGMQVTAIYDAMEDVDVLTIETATPPKVVDLTLFIQLRDENMNLAYILQYNIPKFQVSGNYELSLSADGVSQESLSGKALNVKSEDCNTGDMYATIKWVPVGEAVGGITGVIITNGNIAASSNAAAAFQLTAIGLYGTINNYKVVTDQCTWAAAGGTGITVGEGGLVSITDAATGSATITATYGNFSDSIIVTVG